VSAGGDIHLFIDWRGGRWGWGDLLIVVHQIDVNSIQRYTARMLLNQDGSGGATVARRFRSSTNQKWRSVADAD